MHIALKNGTILCPVQKNIFQTDLFSLLISVEFCNTFTENWRILRYFSQQIDKFHDIFPLLIDVHAIFFTQLTTRRIFLFVSVTYWKNVQGFFSFTFAAARRFSFIIRPINKFHHIFVQPNDLIYNFLSRNILTISCFFTRN